jgi:hypothetical protein
MGNTSRAGTIGRVATIAMYIWIVIAIALIADTITVIVGYSPFLGALQPLGSASIIGLMVSGVLFFIWSYRAMSVAHDLTPTLAISPGWSIGWYFVPVATLWKPYEAMREIWQGSALNNETAAHAPLIGWWWAAWIGRGILGGVAGVLVRESPEISLMCVAAATTLGIVAAVLLTLIIGRINRMQAGAIDAGIFD